MSIDFDPEAALARLEAAAERSNLRPIVPDVKIKDQRISVSLPPNVGADGVTDGLARLGFNPADYEIEHVHYRRAGETDQVKVDLRPVAWRLRPAREPGPTFYSDVERVHESTRKVIVCGDQQRPYDDPQLHEEFLRYLEIARPDEVVNVGDLAVFDSIGNKHPWNPLRNPDPMNETQRCIDCSYGWWHDVRQAAGPQLLSCKQLPGNHEWHLVKAVIEFEEGKLYNLRQACQPDAPPVLSLRHLCRYDELGVDMVLDPLGDWTAAEYAISRWIGAGHGEDTGKKPGDAVWKLIQKRNRSLMIGHTHTQAIVEKTDYKEDGSGEFRVIIGVELGHMAGQQLQGYIKYPGWQQGFAELKVFPDGTFTPPKLATFVEGVLRCGDVTISDTPRGLRIAA